VTTIAFKDGILAADSKICAGGTFAGYETKIHKVKGCLIGGAGSNAVYLAFRSWVAGGMNGACPLTKDIGNMFLVPPKGQPICWCDDGPFFLKTPFWSFGSGDAIALGAMEAGASAEEAVACAAKWDSCTGGPITALNL
jgi:ATP-dependent HslUV protease subunit HslV